MVNVPTLLSLAFLPLAPQPERVAPIALVVRAAPRAAPAPARVVFTVEVKGGADESLRCLSFDWDWGDGSRTTLDECPASAGAGETAVTRVFQAGHLYKQKARPQVRVKLRQGERVLARADIGIAIGPQATKLKFDAHYGRPDGKR
jgi:hypothetical protein